MEQFADIRVDRVNIQMEAEDASGGLEFFWLRK